MNPSSSALPADYFGFADLSALQAAHSRLIKRQGETPVPADFLETVDAFIIRAQATGRVLGDDDTRTAAQAIIDYWVTVLLRGRRTPPETGLCEFGFHAPRESIRERPATEYLTDERVAIRKRLRLSAAAAQWNDGQRVRALLWGGSEVADAALYSDLTPLEKDFIAASFADEKRAATVRWSVITAGAVAAVTIITLIIVGLESARRAARAEQQAAEVAKKLAEENAQIQQHLVSSTFVERAAVLMRDGDVSGSLLWFAQALAKDREAQQDEDIHRIRIGAAMAQLPKLPQALIEERSDYLCGSAKFSADGKNVLMISNPKAGGEGVARLWDVTTGKKLADFAETDARVNDAFFCGDDRILTVSGDAGTGAGRVRLWQRDASASTELSDISGAVLFGAVSPAGDRVAYVCEGLAGKPAVVEVRQISDGLSLSGRLEWSGEVREVTFSPDGNYVVVCGATKETRPGKPPGDVGQVKVWNAWNGATVNWGDMFHDLPVNCASFAPDNLRLVTGTGELGGKRGTVEVWHVFTGQPIFTKDRVETAEHVFTAEHDGRVVSVCFSPDGRRVLSASHDETARVWDSRTGNPLLEFKHESSVYDAAYSPDGRSIVSGGRDHTARLWRVATGRAAVPPLSHGQTVAKVAFSPDGERVLTTTSDGARLWHLQTGEPISPVLQLGDPVWQMAIGADGRHVVAVSHSGAIGTWERQSDGTWGRQSGTTLPGLSEAVAVFFSADASLALVSKGATAQIRKTQGGAAVGPVLPIATGKKLPMSFAAFSPDRSRVLIACGTRGSAEGMTRIWDVNAVEPVSVPLATKGVVTYAAFSEDGRYVLTAGGTRSPAYGEARVWEVATGQPAITQALFHNEEVTHASFNHDLTRVVTASVDDSAKIWTIDLAARTALESHLLAEHSADLTHATFSPNGEFAVTASFDRTAVLWNVENGTRISVLQHPGWINDAHFSHSGRFLVTACADQTARVWDVATGDWVSLFRHDGQVTRAFFTDDDENVVTLSAYEPAQTLRQAQRGVPPAGSGSTEPGREQDSQRTMLKAQTWRLAKAVAPVEALSDFAQLMRSRQISNERDFTRIKRDDFAALWQDRAALIGEFNAAFSPAPPLSAVEESEATGEWFAAKWHLDRLIQPDSTDADLLERRGLASGHLLQWKDAIADYQRAATLRPGRPILLRLARATIELDLLDEAIAHTTKGLETPPSTPPTDDDKQQERNLRMLRAEAYAAQGLWDKAADDLLKSIELRPTSPSAYQRLATVRLKQGRIEEYRQRCAQLLELFGEDFGSLAAWACSLRAGSVPDPAIPVNLAGRALADQPGRYYIINTLGAALYRAGRYDEALEKLKDSCAAYLQAASLAQARSEADAALMPIQDGRPVDWLFLAMAHQKLGHRPQAEEWLKKAQTAIAKKNVTDPRRTWHHLELELLLAEATTQIGSTRAP